MIVAWMMVGSMWFWGFFGIVFCLFLWEAMDESFFLTSSTMVGGLAFLVLFTNFGAVVGGVALSTWLWAAGLYFPIGFVWAVVKYWFKLDKKKSRLLEDYNLKWMDGGAQREGPAQTPTKAKWISDNLDHMKPSMMKSRIAYWISYWPFSFLSTLLSDFIKSIGEWIYRRFQGIFVRIYNRVVKV